MSSTNKTANYQLNQWVGTDPVLMADFNADNAKIDAALAAGLRLATGSYTGTGTSGSSNKSSLHFDFVPKLLFISKVEYNVNSNNRFTSTVFGSCDYFALLPYKAILEMPEKSAALNCTSSTLNFRVNNGSTTPGTNVYTLSDGGKTLTWYNGSGPNSQFNESGKLYYWIAIG